MVRNLLDAVDFGTQLLSEHQIEQARLNAEILLSHLLKLERIDLYLNHDKPMTDHEFAEYSGLLNQRAKGIPVQYLTRCVGFFSHRFLVEEGVFIPRRDTEVLVEEVAGQLREREGTTVLDVGTGCGNIAISLAIRFPSASVYGIDISSKAVSLARQNAKHLGVTERVKFLKGDLFQPISSFGHSMDLIVSNPPYIRKADLENLPLEVKAEPLHTYYGGEDGLQLIRRIVSGGKKYLSEDGMIAIECGYDQAGVVRELMEKYNYERIRVVRDLNGNQRAITAKKGTGPFFISRKTGVVGRKVEFEER